MMESYGVRDDTVEQDPFLQLKKGRRATWGPTAGRTAALYSASSSAEHRDTTTRFASPQISPSSSLRQPSTTYWEASSASRSSLDYQYRPSSSSSSRSINQRHSFTPMAKGKTFASGGSLKNPNPLRLANVKRWDPQTRSTSSWDGLRYVSNSDCLYHFC